MGISLKTHKILWARSGNKCAICKNELIVDPVNSNDDPSIIGDEAHIIARKKSFTRGDFDSLNPEELDHYSNLILLCKVHHKQIDDQPEYYTVDRLRQIKKDHEEEIKATFSKEDEKKQREDIIYSGYIDEWQQFADLDNWRNTSSWLSAGTPSIPKKWYESQKEFLIWFIGRIWPGRYIGIEKAFYNYFIVLQDFINVFEKHINYDDQDSDLIRTEKFYKIQIYDEKLYHKLLNEYNIHDCLVNDLFFELTRAANYICDKVREQLFSGYRLSEGALIIERSSVGYGLKTINVRLEYHDKQRTEVPYPGLKKFKKIRYTERDYALDPGNPKPSSLDEG